MTSFGVDTGVVSGQRSGWSLIRKLGEGDAGEVYLVESLVDNRTAILKRPVRTVFTGEVRRQADQIRTEGRILKALEDILGKLPDARISTPPLLDQSKPGSEFGDRFFIVLGRAAGFDLSTLARIARMGINGDQLPECSPVEQAFLEELARQARMPERVLLACLSAVLTVLEAAHATPVDTGTGEAAGIIWNDVKADHLFWDPTQSGVTVIDWGNGRFLQEGGVSRDMRHTAAGDRRQFLDEMGRLLAQAAPELRERLEWPEQGHIYEDVTPTVMALRKRIDAALAQANHALQEARTREEELLQPALESGLDLAGLEAVHRTIVSMGEIPDYAGALRMISRSASNLAAAGDMGGVRELSSWAAVLPGAQVESLALLARLISVAAREKGEAY
ncbi:MAG: phosphotransferase, partial [Anaerolineae bacterium]|nr:phosphotransferase [Anaerolineae bacterium]